MSAIYVTTAYDALDLICARHYGVQAGAAEQVLEANPHIAAVAHRLPAGLTISLPDLASSSDQQTVSLWD